jgi:pfkB family carbohydrate kinase
MSVRLNGQSCQSPREGLNRALQFDYISVGHVTVDILEDGSRRPGGTALFGALQAARLGLRSLIVTRGVPAEIEGMLAPWAGELELQVQAAEHTTTLQTRRHGAERSQRLEAWAGPIESQARLLCAILHLAPVAAELPEQWPTGGRLLGLTPQGLARSWPAGGGEVIHVEPSAAAVTQARNAYAIVISQAEEDVCGQMIQGARRAGSLIAVTAGEEPTRILPAQGDPLEIPVRRIEQPADDLGAGDCYAAALFTGLAEGRGAREAGQFAIAAAALRMLGTGPGAIAGRSEVEAAMASAGASPG